MTRVRPRRRFTLPATGSRTASVSFAVPIGAPWQYVRRSAERSVRQLAEAVFRLMRPGRTYVVERVRERGDWGGHPTVTYRARAREVERGKDGQP